MMRGVWWSATSSIRTKITPKDTLPWTKRENYAERDRKPESRRDAV
jgi:hypothetical protein